MNAMNRYRKKTGVTLIILAVLELVQTLMNFCIYLADGDVGFYVSRIFFPNLFGYILFPLCFLVFGIVVLNKTEKKIINLLFLLLVYKAIGNVMGILSQAWMVVYALFVYRPTINWTDWVYLLIILIRVVVSIIGVRFANKYKTEYPQMHPQKFTYEYQTPQNELAQ